jgi:hypothetical protein
VVKAWQVVVPEASKLSKNRLAPRQQVLAERADHPRLREVGVTVDEARQDQPPAHLGHSQPRMPNAVVAGMLSRQTLAA